MIGLPDAPALADDNKTRAVGMFGKWFNEASGFMKAATVIDDVVSEFSRVIRAACRRAFASRMQAAILFLALCLPMFGAVAPASAQDVGPWHAIEVRGVVYVRAANGTIDDWRPLAADEILYEDSDVRTWKDGTATLTNGLDTIRLQPNAQVTLRSPERQGLWMGLRHKLGIIFYDVGKFPGRQFSVDAPEPCGAGEGHGILCRCNRGRRRGHRRWRRGQGHCERERQERDARRRPIGVGGGRQPWRARCRRGCSRRSRPGRTGQSRNWPGSSLAGAEQRRG